jgi:hypothetical protein
MIDQDLLEEIIEHNKQKFSDEFIKWFPINIHVWDAFVAEAIKVQNKGYKHYSARTIIHVLRHHSAISENESEWKINNNYSPYLARLFDLVYPHKAGLFEYRSVKRNQND